jgi:hypothetical protein
MAMAEKNETPKPIPPPKPTFPENREIHGENDPPPLRT